MHDTHSDPTAWHRKVDPGTITSCTEIGDKPLAANSFPSARLLKIGEVISLFFGSGTRFSNRVRGSEKSRKWGGPLRMRENPTLSAGPALPGPGCQMQTRVLEPSLEAQLSTMKLQKSLPGRPGMLIFDIGPLSKRTKKATRVRRHDEMARDGTRGEQNLRSSPFVSHLWLKTNSNDVGYTGIQCEESQLDGPFVR